MARFQFCKFHKLFSMLVAVAVGYAALLVAAEPANAELGLFRARRVWWFSQGGTWTDMKVWPRDAASITMMGNVYPTATPTFPSNHATATIGSTPFATPSTPNPSFNIPKSVVKDTTYFWSCPTPGPPPFDCYPGYLVAQYQYSYWNGAGHFQKNHSQAAATTTTIRRRTIYDGGGNQGTLPPTVPTPTVMSTLVTPTSGGCKVGDAGIAHPRDCAGTTQFNGDYTTSRGGSIMITPGGNKFGGTLRWFAGPNDFSYQRISYFTPIWFKATGMSPPVSLQPSSNDPKEIGYVELTGTLRRVRLTNPAHVLADLLGTTVEGAGTKPCTDTLMTAAVRVFPPFSQQPATLLGDPASNTPTDSGCEYYQKTANYLRTGAPYTTGMAQNWEPLGGFSSKNTETGYDNRTAGGLNGRISMVAPRLLHVYTRDPESIGGEANLTWSSSRMRRIDFIFVPEPVGVAILAAGFVTLAGLHRLRRR